MKHYAVVNPDWKILDHSENHNPALNLGDITKVAKWELEQDKALTFVRIVEIRTLAEVHPVVDSLE